MEGSRVEGRTHWKQSVVRNNPHDSRILAADKHLPNKFSPSRPVVSPKNQSLLLRTKLADLSQDDARLPHRSANLRSPSPRYNSEPNEELTPRIRPTDNQQAAGSLKELKVDFMRLKEQALKDIKSLGDYVAKTTQSVNARVNSGGNVSAPVMSVPQLATPLSKVSPVQLESLGIAGRRSANPGPLMTRHHNDLAELRRAVSEQRGEFSTLTPLIRTELGQFQQLICSLKDHLGNPLPA